MIKSAWKSVQIKVFFLVVFLLPSLAWAADSGQIYFSEGFEDLNFTARGWYSVTQNQTVVYDEERKGNVLQFYAPEAGMVSGISMRHTIPETESVYVRFYVKYSENWEWTGQMYGPHEIYIITNKQASTANPAITNLTCYIEANNGKPHLVMQDALNIDSSRINEDLSDITENRAVAGGNGCGADGAEYCSAYYSTVVWRWLNGKGWKTSDTLIDNNKWYLIEASFKMNSIVNGKAVADGHVKYWLNNTLVINSENVILRTGQNPDMQFKYIIIAPYFHGGVPHPQGYWIDDFAVSDGSIGGSGLAQDLTPPAEPTGLTLILKEF